MAPLLFTRRALVVLGIAVGLSDCRSYSNIPSFTASGYVADQGVIRLWRKNDDQHRAQALMSVYSPYHGSGTVTTFYTYQDGVLRAIKRTVADGDRDSIQLRFTGDGTVSFMQRQLVTRREQLSSDEITLYQYQGRRILEVSDALQAGQVKLRQGRWLQGEVQTCDGQRLKPGLSANAKAWVKKRARNGSQRMNIAWLDAPEGRALLLVANDDFCRWEPKEDQL